MGISSHVKIIVYFLLFSVLVSKGSSLLGFPTTVHIRNDIEGYSVYLNYHCQSGDDDLGQRGLNFGEEWHWKFHVNLGSTYFWCDYRWYDNWNYRWYEGSHEVYDAKVGSALTPHYFNLCHTDCVWSARRDGMYLLRHPEGTWEKRYSWPV
ncbi:S-protein homolog 5-like [Papaver somniferum]|uniref:S-protein homolog 5-like n=1 Tax=Papaver somniferum TaxID=3469 RepID=UPI000E6F881E|nr:S-protein homolog 5-like [Papaver somniferum]